MKRLCAIILCLVMLLTGCEALQSLTQTPVSRPESTPESTPEPTPKPTSQPTPQPTPEITPEPEPTVVSIAVVGDLLCLSAQLSSARKGSDYNFEPCFAPVADKLSAADLCIGNLETLVASDYPYTKPNPTNEGESDGGEGGAGEAAPETPAAPNPDAPEATPTKRPNPKVNAPEEFLSALSGCGFDVLTMANNHMYDYKEDGLIKTLDKVKEYGFLHTGSYAAPEDKVPLIADVNGVQVAVLAYTAILNNRPGKDKAFMIDTYSQKTAAADIAAAQEAGADYIIVCVHWGNENTHSVNRSQKKIAAELAQAGADIILGAHPHCVQTSEMLEGPYGGVPVFYSLGNFISSMPRTINKDGMIVHIELKKEHTGELSVNSLTYTPTYCGSGYTVYPADAASIAKGGQSGLSSSRKRVVSVVGEAVAAAN